MAKELGVNFRSTSGPVIAKAGDLAALLTNLEERDVLFIDEIHRLSPAVEEILYPAMEDFPARPHHRRGAGRALGEDRSGQVHAGRRDDPHRPLDDAAARPLRHPGPPQFLHDPRTRTHREARGAADEPADGRRRRARDRAARPRHAAHCRPPPAPRARLRDDGRFRDGGPAHRRRGADAARRRQPRLDQLDRRYLDLIALNFGGGPVGIETIAAALSEPRDAIEDIVEPYLLQQGLSSARRAAAS